MKRNKRNKERGTKEGNDKRGTKEKSEIGGMRERSEVGEEKKNERETKGNETNVKGMKKTKGE